MQSHKNLFRTRRIGGLEQRVAFVRQKHNACLRQGFNQEKQRAEDEEREIQEAIAAEAVDSDEEASPVEGEVEVKNRGARRHSKEPFIFRVFKVYVERHNVPTPHIFWLRLKKNILLFHAQFVSFINNHLLDILRLVNIGMMTVACRAVESV